MLGFVVFALVVAAGQVEANTGVCTKQVPYTFTWNQVEYYQRPYTVLYCLLFCIPQTTYVNDWRWKPRSEIRYRYETTCCAGYTGNPGAGVACSPVCISPCINGICVSPNTCKCHDGYTMSQNSTCEPECSICPSNAKCIKPEEWQCDVGYELSDNYSCEPRCSNCPSKAKCVKPEECQCDVGYELSDNNSCEPQCSSCPCNATCIKPEEWQCDVGFKLSDNSTCEP